ncbi:isoprenoid biosynthesis glyoxalase ElbB, partial [bacterium]|nr:isoprenoid biosynthesis glyoxalase ElbB [bacterium]
QTQCFALSNQIEDSAKISRGNVKDVVLLNPAEFDGLVLPGGYGAAKNLSDWAVKGAQCQVDPDVARVIQSFYDLQKPIAAICIAPAVVARVLGKHGISVTIGNDKETAAEITKTGAIHENCPVEDYISDRDHRILSTPAYMYEAKPHEVFNGISKMLREFVELA